MGKPPALITGVTAQDGSYRAWEVPRFSDAPVLRNPVVRGQ